MSQDGPGWGRFAAWGVGEDRLGGWWRGAGGAGVGDGLGSGVGAHAAVAAGAEEVEQGDGEEGGFSLLVGVLLRGGGVPGTGEACEAAEEGGEEGEEHGIQRAGERAQFSCLRLERSAQAGKVLGEGGGMGCHEGEYI